MTLEQMAAYLTDRNSKKKKGVVDKQVIAVKLDTILYFGFEEGEKIDADDLRAVLAAHIAEVGVNEDDMRGVSATWELEDLEPADEVCDPEWEVEIRYAKENDDRFHFRSLTTYIRATDEGSARTLAMDHFYERTDDFVQTTETIISAERTYREIDDDFAYRRRQNRLRGEGVASWETEVNY